MLATAAISTPQPPSTTIRSRCSTDYRRLIALRHDDDVVVDGEFAMLLPDDPHVYAFTRWGSDRELLVLGNFSGETQPVDVPPDWVGATLLLGNYVDDPAPHPGVVPALRPWEARVYERRKGR